MPSSSSPSDTSTSTPTSTSVTRHRNSDFYLDTKVFLVEDELFRIPTKYFVENSGVFRDMLSLPQTEESAEGATDEKPIVLEGIKKVAFQALLKVIFHFGPLSKFTNPALGPLLTDEQWLSLLSLSNMWELVEIRDTAITTLEKIMKTSTLREIEWVLRGRTYSVPEWVEYGYHQFAFTPDVITVDEAEELGIDSALKLAGIQGRVYARYNPLKLKGCWGRVEPTESEIRQAVFQDVRSVFAKEIKDVTYTTQSTQTAEPIPAPAPMPPASDEDDSET